MSITGIIAEYNPLHFGHVYHMQQARERTETEGIIVVMSGNYTQRGEPAILDKYRRAETALAAGADVVLELPVSYASGTAERFASGAVEILDRLGAVTHLAYGAENTSDPLCERIAEYLCGESESFREQLQQEVRSGHTYPEARSLALEKEIPGAADYLRHPNNILAVEYRKALLRRNSSIRPLPILRVGAGHRQGQLPANSEYASSSAIRNALLTAEDCPGEISDRLSVLLPEESRKRLNYTVSADDLSSLLLYALYTLPYEALCSMQDMSAELASRARSLCGEVRTFSELAQRLKTRNVTLTRVNRALLHTVLQLPKPAPSVNLSDPLPAVRLLGFRRDTPLMRKLQDGSDIPIVTKLADAPSAWFSEDLRSDAIYRSLVRQKTGIRLKDEYRSRPVIWS